ncbi:MAG: replication initiation factor domain-containing protein [Planctomycetota bacterium]
MSGPEVLRRSVEDTLIGWFGPDVEDGGQKNGYRQGVKWQHGAALMWGGESQNGTLLVHLPGKALTTLPAESRHTLMCELAELGLHATRLDCAFDWWGANLDLCDNAQQAEEAGEVCGTGSRASSVIRSKHSGVAGAFTVYLGTRGKKGSGKFVRIYDKGLEQREITLPNGVHHRFQKGEWERWETVFAGDCAKQACEMLVEAGAKVWPQTMAEMTFAVSDFRETTGRRELERRPRLAWFQRLLDTLALVNIVPERPMRELSKTAGWVHKSVAPILIAMAEASEMSVADVFGELTTGARPSKRTRKSPVVAQWLRYQSGDIDPRLRVPA